MDEELERSWLLARVDRNAAIEAMLTDIADPSAVAWFAEPNDVGGLRLDHLSGSLTPHLDGLDIPAGRGLTGKLMLSARPESVTDYFRSRRITHDFDRIVAEERVKRMIAAPVIAHGQSFGVLTVAYRRADNLGDRSIDELAHRAQDLAEKLQIINHYDQKIDSELARQRDEVASRLHDEVGARVFGISAQLAGLISRVGDDPELLAIVDRLRSQTADLNQVVRDSIRDLEYPTQALHWLLNADLVAFEERTGISTELLSLSSLSWLDRVRVHTLLSAIREALLNIEKHSGATRIVISVSEEAGTVNLAIIDNGVTPYSPQAPHGHGIAAMRRGLAQLGGQLTITGHHDADASGTTVRLRIPAL